MEQFQVSFRAAAIPANGPRGHGANSELLPYAGVDVIAIVSLLMGHIFCATRYHVLPGPCLATVVSVGHKYQPSAEHPVCAMDGQNTRECNRIYTAGECGGFAQQFWWRFKSLGRKITKKMFSDVEIFSCVNLT